MIRSLILTVILSLSLLLSYAQKNDSSYFESYRVGFSQSSRTLRRGGFLLEGRFSINQSSISNGTHSRTWSLLNTPQLKLGYGINNFMEVFVNQNSYRFQNNSHFGHNGVWKSNNIGVGFKFNVSKQKGMLPQSAISVSQNLWNRTYGNSFFQTRVNFSWSYDLGQRFNLAGNIMYNYSEIIKNDFGLSLKLSYKINQNLGLFTEWYVADYAYELTVFNIGAYYKISPMVMLNANIGTNHFITSYPSEGKNYNFKASIGVSFLLNDPNKKKKTK